MPTKNSQEESVEEGKNSYKARKRRDRTNYGVRERVEVTTTTQLALSSLGCWYLEPFLEPFLELSLSAPVVVGFCTGRGVARRQRLAAVYTARHSG